MSADNGGPAMKAYELLEKPEAWTKGARAKDIHEWPCDPKSSAAVCWDAVGAIDKCHPGKTEIKDAFRHHLCGSISFWNDAPERTHAEVVAKLKELDI